MLGPTRIAGWGLSVWADARACNAPLLQSASGCGASGRVLRARNASRSSCSIWALTLRSSAAAKRSTAACTAGSSRNGKAFFPGLATR